MTMSLTSPVTGTAQTGLTSPTYTVAVDVAPDLNSRQYVVTAIGGTQSGVLSSSILMPFTITMFRPKQYKVQGTPNPVTGVISNVPKNVHKIIVRKGVDIDSTGDNHGNRVLISMTIETPAGSEANSPNAVRAALSLMIGALSQISSGIGDTITSGQF